MMQIYIYMISTLIMLILVIIMNMISVAFLTLFERKIMGLFHYRKGPNKISFIGFFQPFSDAMKLLSKELFFPLKSNMYMYIISPMFMFFLTMSMWMIYPFMSNLLTFKLNLLYFISLMSMGVFSLMIMGWSSNSMFSMIGSIRSIAQSISYEVTFSLSLLIMMMIMNSLNLMKLIPYSKYIFLLFTFFPSMLILITSILAEINRTPFDLTEGESELVSGFNIEYGSSKFTLIFLAEYSSILFMMLIFNFIYINTNLMNFLFYFMIMIMFFMITWIRMTFPRIRYDKLMYFCWFFLLPFSLINFLLYMMFMKFPLDLMIILN
uniref:NADH-ubiquinone oxidoreductase chain 1 n=1 Tax=Capitonius sp. QL-2013 TaxID=1421593 RepID=A0A0A6ZLQ5_9HYME|nr:NADH dehydrogenase subunit 1 [Capitonius sp. QL-2013]